MGLQNAVNRILGTTTAAIGIGKKFSSESFSEVGIDSEMASKARQELANKIKAIEENKERAVKKREKGLSLDLNIGGNR